jgi:hypothetical protein
MKLVTILPFLAIAKELPQHRVRKATRPLLYHHILHQLEKQNVSKFWIPFYQYTGPSHTSSRRTMYGSQRLQASQTESSEQQHEKTAFTNVQWDDGSSLWFVHGDASLHSPEQVYHQRKNEREPEKKESGSFLRSKKKSQRRVQTTLKEDTTYALSEQDSTYTAGDTDLIYDDALGSDRESKPLNGTLQIWNVSTTVEYGTEGGEGDNNDNTNSTSSVVYTTTGESNNTTAFFQPIRIRAILSEQGNGGEFLTEKERKIIFQDILSPAIVAWSAALRVDPVVGNLTVDKSQLYDGETCGPGLDSGYPTVPVPPSHLEEGIPDTDIVVYLSLGFVTEPNTLNPFSEDLIGSNSRNSTDASNASNAFTNSSEEWSLNSNATYGIGDTKYVEWPSCTGEYLASASYCSTDQYDRPTAALLHLCIHDSFFLERSVERDISTVMHELGHALGFNTQSMAHFRRPDGTPITPRDDGDVVDSEVECTGPSNFRRTQVLPLPSEEILQFRTVRGVRVAEVVTPSVRQVVRNHFDCQSLDGAELESGIVHVSNASRGVSDDEALVSCIGDHWEKRLFRIDLMSPVVDEIPFSLRFSPVT